MKSFNWLVQLNNKKIRKKCLLYTVFLSIMFIAFQKNYGIVLTGYITFITLLIVHNRIIYQSYIENDIIVLLVIYKDLNSMIKKLIQESIIKSMKVMTGILLCILLHNYFYIHESFSKPIYLLLLDGVIFLIMSIILSLLHMFLLFFTNGRINKFIDILFLFISSAILTVYIMDIDFLSLYYLLLMILMTVLTVIVKKHISKEKLMLV